MARFDVRRVDGDATLPDAYAVRRAVFVDEQDISPDVEFDGNDDDAVHFVAYDTADDTPVGTARFRVVDGVGKAERVAVLPACRGEGLGARLMDHVETEAHERGLESVHLNAQTTVEGFYHQLGYETVSEEFEQASIPHVEMVNELDV